MMWSMRNFDSFTLRKSGRWFLAFSWVLGLGFGGLVFRSCGETAVSLMRLALYEQVSIVGLLLSSLLPFLFSAFAVYLHCPGLLLVICFFRAFLYSYFLCSLFGAFGPSGWLLRWLFLFTDSCAAALLYGYAQGHITGYSGFSPGRFALFSLCVGLLTGVDYKIILPILGQLLSR